METWSLQMGKLHFVVRGVNGGGMGGCTPNILAGREAMPLIPPCCDELVSVITMSQLTSLNSTCSFEPNFNTAAGSGEHCKLPQRGPGQSPA